MRIFCTNFAAVHREKTNLSRRATATVVRSKHALIAEGVGAVAKTLKLFLIGFGQLELSAVVETIAEKLAAQAEQRIKSQTDRLMITRNMFLDTYLRRSSTRCKRERGSSHVRLISAK